MNDSHKLSVLKNNLQLLTDSQDLYLKELLKQAESLMKREGIVNDGTNDYDMAVVDYSAFLFRCPGICVMSLIISCFRKNKNDI